MVNAEALAERHKVCEQWMENF